MSTERDELAEDIRSLGITVIDGPPVDLTEPLAQHLHNLGYRKPRTITTSGERSTLRPGTICMDMNGNAWKRGTGSWVGTGDGAPLFDDDDMTMTVLHEGSAS